MVEVFLALLFVVGMHLSLGGTLVGTYMLFCLVALHVVIVIVMSSLSVGRNASPMGAANQRRVNYNKVAVGFVFQVFLAATAYHLFIIGYPLVTGVLLATVPIAFFSSILHLMGSEKEEEQ